MDPRVEMVVDVSDAVVSVVVVGGGGGGGG